MQFLAFCHWKHLGLTVFSVATLERVLGLVLFESGFTDLDRILTWLKLSGGNMLWFSN